MTNITGDCTQYGSTRGPFLSKPCLSSTKTFTKGYGVFTHSYWSSTYDFLFARKQTINSSAHIFGIKIKSEKRGLQAFHLIASAIRCTSRNENLHVLDACIQLCMHREHYCAKGRMKKYSSSL